MVVIFLVSPSSLLTTEKNSPPKAVMRPTVGSEQSTYGGRSAKMAAAASSTLNIVRWAQEAAGATVLWKLDASRGSKSNELIFFELARGD